MSQNKTQFNTASVATFLNAVEPAGKQADAHVLDKLFRSVSGFAPQMYGTRIIGYGRYHYRYASGREGQALATGFSPRKAKFSIYIMPGYADFSPILKDLGKHKLGKSCVYVNKLADIDIEVLGRLIKAGLEDLARQWPIVPT